jgi:serine/threonine protein kinase
MLAECRVRYTAEEAAPLFAQASAGLAHLHASGFAHRDLKLENMCTTRRGPDATVKLVDLGCAAACGAGEHALTGMWGSPYYVAPEVARWKAWAGEGHAPPPCYGLEADCWSLGVCLFVMLSATSPWSDS